MKLSIVIPVYNEKKTIIQIIDAVNHVDLPDIEKEIIVVDDFSTDGTREVLAGLSGIEVCLHQKNMGKGSAVKTGFSRASGEIVVIQDADMEYDPNDYKKLLVPILRGQADVVYGSRFIGGDPKRVLYIWHMFGNRFLTILSNILTGLTLTDMETCYKMFRKEAIDSFYKKLQSKRFGIEPEITARIAQGKWRVYEVGIAYYGRTYTEGKKINWRDGVLAIWQIIKFNLLNK